MRTISSEVFIFAFKFFNAVGLRFVYSTYEASLKPHPSPPLGKGREQKHLVRKHRKFPARSRRYTNTSFRRINADHFSCIFGFQKLFMGRGFIYSLGRRLCVGHCFATYGLHFISKNGGQIAHPTNLLYQYELRGL